MSNQYENIRSFEPKVNSYKFTNLMMDNEKYNDFKSSPMKNSVP